MIHLPTAPWAHLVFDVLAWACGASLGVGLYRWRLRAGVERLALSAGPGYFASLGAGAILGGWAAGSLNTLQGPAPALSHSVAGALAGAIVGVEFYKAARKLRGST
jgi:phosphatidylglycerol:prolipoprotein diacylglycerol transferase